MANNAATKQDPSNPSSTTKQGTGESPALRVVGQDKLTEEVRLSARGKSVMDAPAEGVNRVVTTADTVKSISFGSSIDAIQSGKQILIPSKSGLKFDAVVERVQESLRSYNIKNSDGSKIVVDGLFGSKTANGIAALRVQLNLKPGQFIDKDLIENLFPQQTLENVENGRVTITKKNAGKVENPIVKEVQRLLNQNSPETKLEENGLFSTALIKHLVALKDRNYLQANASIDAVTLRLLKGESLQSIVASGVATLTPGNIGALTANEFVAKFQGQLKNLTNSDIVVDGKFGAATAGHLEKVQRIADLKERGVFSKETYEKLNDLINNPLTLAAFKEKAKEIEIVDKVFSNLPKDSAVSLQYKMEAVSIGANDFERGFLISLKKLEIDLQSAAGITKFQQSRGLKAHGSMTQETAAAVNEVLSAQWCKERVLEQNPQFQWKAGKNEINFVGLRGWSPEKGQNSNSYNQWNDTFAIAWTDQQGLLRYKEFAGSTDPGLRYYSKAPDVNKDGCGDVGHLAPGQYQYRAGYFHGYSGFGVPARGKEVRIFRDINHDGALTDADGVVAENGRPGFFGRLIDRLKSYMGDESFLIHAMRTSSNPKDIAEVKNFSAGCQVTRISMKQFKQEITPLIVNNPGSFPYTLIDMSTNSQFNSTMAERVAQLKREGEVAFR